MPWPQTYSPADLHSPLVSLADLPAVTLVAQSAAPASPTSVQTACAVVWRSATSDVRSRFRARAVARAAPGPALSTLPRATGSGREASWLTCAEYRTHLLDTISSTKKKVVQKNLARYTASCGSHVRSGLRQSMPSSSIDNCARVNETVPLPAPLPGRL